VAAIRPEVAVYSAGKANSYGYLHREALERLAIAGVMVYGTDVHGTVTVAGDGVGYTVTTDRAGEAPPPRRRQRASSGRRRHRARVRARARSTSTPPEPKNWTEFTHVGAQRSTQIVAVRPFSDLDDLVRVDGIGVATVEAIRQEGLACAS
jgi:competence protein ComEC